MNKTFNEFIKELELLKEEYIKRGYRDYNTADRQSYGQFVELNTILFQLKKIQENQNK
jgi:hypothetical protein